MAMPIKNGTAVENRPVQGLRATKAACTFIGNSSLGEKCHHAVEDGGVHQVDEERTHQRHNQKRFVRRAEHAGNRLHVGNGGWCCS